MTESLKQQSVLKGFRHWKPSGHCQIGVRMTYVYNFLPILHANFTQTNYTQGNLREILLNQTETRLYLPCTDRFWTANGQCSFAVPNKSVHGKYNLISSWFNNISKRFLCVYPRRKFVPSRYLSKHKPSPPRPYPDEDS